MCPVLDGLFPILERGNAVVLAGLKVARMAEQVLAVQHRARHGEAWSVWIERATDLLCEHFVALSPPAAVLDVVSCEATGRKVSLEEIPQRTNGDDFGGVLERLARDLPQGSRLLVPHIALPALKARSPQRPPRRRQRRSVVYL